MAESGSSSGPSIDRAGTPVVDPTDNVLRELAAAVKRQDDLMAANKELQREIARGQSDLLNARHACLTDIANLRAQHSKELSDKETQRLDAIRLVDVSAVKQAAEVQALQAGALATTLATTAETLRNQVISTASAQATALGATVQPLIKAIEDLRQAQFLQQGEKTQKTEGTQNNQWIWGAIVGAVGMVVGVVSLIVVLVKLG